jgi:hypothetical protein
MHLGKGKTSFLKTWFIAKIDGFLSFPPLGANVTLCASLL